MDQLLGTVNETGKSAPNLGEISPPHEKKRATQRSGKPNFAYWNPEAQREAFFAWLPQEVHDAPGIDWTKLPPEIMGYCVKTIGRSPDAVTLALAAASLYGAVSLSSYRTKLKEITGLLRSLRVSGYIQSLTDLKQEHIWNTWAACQKKTQGTRGWVDGYISIATGHFPLYLLRLAEADRQRMQAYALPLPPPDFRRKYFPSRLISAAQQEKRKATTDILTPLYPVLRQLIRLRKQLAERVVLAIREAKRLVETGEAVLPYHFQHTDIIPEVNREAKTISEARIEGREVVMKFTLWNQRTWALTYRDRYSYANGKLADISKRTFSQKQSYYFVQFNGPSKDLLWCGEFVEHRLFQQFEKDRLHLEGYQERWQMARQFGFSAGCVCSRPGLLSPGLQWLAEAAERGDELIFDYESLYRGILMGAALAMLALSNGSRLSELLQVSWNKERRVTRTETVVLLGKDGQAQFGTNGKPLTKQVKLHFQHLLPKGAKTAEERQLFPLSKEALRLLGEIRTLLEETYGHIPVVAPSRSHTKREHLVPEHYLFQWDASPNGEVGALNTNDVGTLLRFVFHGLDLYTAQGKPIRVSVHVLRHVMATHARRYRNVPPEVIAHFFLHHRLKERTGRTPSLSEVTEYYTLMTEEQRFAVISADLDKQEELDHALLQAAPSLRDLEQKNEDIRAVYEVWHALHPTALGNCGCPGLCPRGNDRSLCLGCSYHVEDPEKLGAAQAWRASYAQQAELLEAQGNGIDARQARIKVQLLDDMISVMHMQLEEEAAGRYIPVFKVLPSPYRNREKSDEAED